MTGRVARTLGVGACTAAVVVGAASGPAAAGASTVTGNVLVFAVDRVSFENLLSNPEMTGLASQGGASLMSGSTSLGELEAQVVPRGSAPVPGTVSLTGLGSMEGPDGAFSADRLASAADRIQASVGGVHAPDLLVVVFTPRPGWASIAAHDELTGVIVARGSPSRLASAMASSSTSLRTLTSDSTQRDGVVTSYDVVPTVLEALGRPMPSDLTGSPIRVVGAPPPFDLSARYLQQRRLSQPIGTAAALYVTIGGVLCVVVLARRRRLAKPVLGLGGGIAISAPVLAVALLEVGHLPSLTYGTVVPFLVGVTAAGAIALVMVGRRTSPSVSIALLGVAILATLAVESALGWTAALTPLLGGSQLDGGRFFGMPNVEVGLVLGGSLYAAHRIRSPVVGAALVFAGGLFAGLPWTGSNLGGAVTLFAGAGLWFSLRRERGRVTWRALVWVVVSAIVGLALVLVAHRFLTSVPTHITRFEEGGARTIGGVLRKLGDRLLVGIRLIEHSPFAILPVIGVPLTLAVVLRPPEPFRETFERWPTWRQAVLAILLAGFVAYVANDSGAAAIGQSFTTALGGLLYVSLLAARAKMVGT